MRDHTFMQDACGFAREFVRHAPPGRLTQTRVEGKSLLELVLAMCARLLDPARCGGDAAALNVGGLALDLVAHRGAALGLATVAEMLGCLVRRLLATKHGGLRRDLVLLLARLALLGQPPAGTSGTSSKAVSSDSGIGGANGLLNFL